MNLATTCGLSYATRSVVTSTLMSVLWRMNCSVKKESQSQLLPGRWVEESRKVRYSYFMTPVTETKLRPKGQITIPRAARDAVHLEEGDPIAVEVVEEGILLKPRKIIDPDQAWFWTKEWQEGEREADADIAAGRGRIFMSDEEFQAALDEVPLPEEKN